MIKSFVFLSLLFANLVFSTMVAAPVFCAEKQVRSLSDPQTELTSLPAPAHDCHQDCDGSEHCHFSHCRLLVALSPEPKTPNSASAQGPGYKDSLVPREVEYSCFRPPAV